MAKKVILKDQNDIELMPITRGELVLDSSGVIALHSNQFLATDSQPGLMSVEDKEQVNRLYDGVVTDDKVSQVTTTNDDDYRVLFSVTADDQDKIEGSYKSSKLLFNPHTGVLSSTIFQGNLDGFYVSALSNYVKLTEEQNITVSDTLNQALGKLEYKADLGVIVYKWYRSITDTDIDNVINKWYEITDFLENINDDSNILDEFVTRKTDQEIIGTKTFTKQQNFTESTDSPFTVSSNKVVTNLNADLLDGFQANNLLTNLSNVNTSENPNSISITVGNNTKYLKVNNSIYSNNLVGGSQGNIVYQSNINTTSFLENPTTNGQILRFNSESKTPYWSSDKDYYRPIQVGGTTILNDNNTSLNLVAGSNITLTPEKSGSSYTGKITINSINDNTTYSLSGSLSGNNYIVTLSSSEEPATYANIAAMTAATTSNAGKAGLVPAPAANKHTSYLRGDGQWVIPTDTKNTAGSTNSTSKLYLIGATSQATNPQTYSNSNLYIENGVLKAINPIYAQHFYENSDVNLKQNIKPIDNTNNIPEIKEFDWKSDGTHSFGLIAQELEELGYTELVSTKEDGYKTVNYSAALALIVGKLQLKIKELEKEIEILKNKN